MRDLASVQGIIVATLTPYGPAGAVDHGVVREHVGFLAERGIPAVAPVGTTGEFLFLSDEERRSVVRAAVEGAAGRAAVIAGIWAETAEQVRQLAQNAAEAGADAVFLTPPIYYRYPESSVAAWYANAARGSGLPVLCYNIPAYSGNEISLRLFQRLLQEELVAGIKDSSGEADRLVEQLRVAGSQGRVYAASDSFALEASQLGAHGFISALANVFPRTYVAIWSGDAAAQARADAARDAVKSSGGIAAIKYLLEKRGFPCGGTRQPFIRLDEQQRKDLDRVWEQVHER